LLLLFPKFHLYELRWLNQGLARLLFASATNSINLLLATAAGAKLTVAAPLQRRA
jgi:hypothetical protein